MMMSSPLHVLVTYEIDRVVVRPATPDQIDEAVARGLRLLDTLPVSKAGYWMADHSAGVVILGSVVPPPPPPLHLTSPGVQMSHWGALGQS